MNEGEVEDVLKACAGPEDEEGFIKYESEYRSRVFVFFSIFDRYPNDYRTIGLCSSDESLRTPANPPFLLSSFLFSVFCLSRLHQKRIRR